MGVGSLFGGDKNVPKYQNYALWLWSHNTVMFLKTLSCALKFVDFRICELYADKTKSATLFL